MNDLTGKVYGRLTVLRYSHSKHGAYWECICTCGKKKIASANCLRTGGTKSCGCLTSGAVDHEKRAEAARKRWEKRLGKLDILPGTKIGFLTVIEVIGRSLRVRCRCGKEFIKQSSLILKDYRSCGCAHDELATGDNNARAALVHGWSETPEHNAWMHIIARCTNPNNAGYYKYGARGISVCARWREKFQNFLDDMGPRPEGKTSIDRINNDGNYEPGNCRWSTPAEQAKNTRRSVILEFNGKRQNMADWARELKISTTAIHNRRKAGLPIEQVLSTNNVRNGRPLAGVANAN